MKVSIKNGRWMDRIMAVIPFHKKQTKHDILTGVCVNWEIDKFPVIDQQLDPALCIMNLLDADFFFFTMYTYLNDKNEF
jgi:hypothetical protein